MSTASMSASGVDGVRPAGVGGGTTPVNAARTGGRSDVGGTSAAVLSFEGVTWAAAVVTAPAATEPKSAASTTTAGRGVRSERGMGETESDTWVPASDESVLARAEFRLRYDKL